MRGRRPSGCSGTLGYKFETNGVTMLYTERCLRVMSASAYSAIDEAN